MVKNKNNQTIWNTRIKKKTSTVYKKVGSSIQIDKRLYKEDLFASLIHTKMLMKKKIIPTKDGKKIINGLNKIKSQIEKGKFIFKEKYEDIHLNIEKKLFDLIGPSAGYMHTARSRNDQVITDFKRWIKN